jgi:hypothetical protein
LSIADTSRQHDSFRTYQTSAVTQNLLALRTTAVWIVEAAGVSGTISKLASFGSVQFTSALATISGVTGAINSPSWQSLALAIVSHKVIYDTT